MPGGQATDDEAQPFLKKKPCSSYEMKEVTGSGILAANDADGRASPKKPISLPEFAKQRELNGTLQTESDANIKKKTNINFKV